uniref:Uncharacterized protein n=1 Tax=Solanum tuberosum TaxID=4113 RepID=M1DDU7_SOLTU
MKTTEPKIGRGPLDEPSKGSWTRGNQSSGHPSEGTTPRSTRQVVFLKMDRLAALIMGAGGVKLEGVSTQDVDATLFGLMNYSNPIGETPIRSATATKTVIWILTLVKGPVKLGKTTLSAKANSPNPSAIRQAIRQILLKSCSLKLDLVVLTSFEFFAVMAKSNVSRRSKPTQNRKKGITMSKDADTFRSKIAKLSKSYEKGKGKHKAFELSDRAER